MTGTCSPHCLLIFQNPLGFGSQATYSLFMEVNEAVCSLRGGQQNIQRAKKKKKQKNITSTSSAFFQGQKKKSYLFS